MDKSVKFSISDATKEILSNYPYMDDFLEKKCVNYSALAEMITPKISEMLKKTKINKQAVIISIIRYSQDLRNKNISKHLLTIISESNLTLKTDIMYINVPKTIANLKIVESFYSKIKWDKGEIFFVMQGIGEISVVLDNSNYKLIEKHFIKSEIEIQFPTTAIVIVHSSSDPGPGFIHYLTKPVAQAGISVELLTMTRDTILLVDEKNATKLFEILKMLVDEAKILV